KITCGDFKALRKLTALTGITGRWTKTKNHCAYRTALYRRVACGPGAVRRRLCASPLPDFARDRHQRRRNRGRRALRAAHSYAGPRARPAERRPHPVRLDAAIGTHALVGARLGNPAAL